MSDQHHADCWEGGTRRQVRTPHLAELAREGVVFTRAYCNNPICAPSRACFLTGQYVCHHGVSGNFVYDFQGNAQYNLATHFRDAGYETALIGKGHLPKKWMNEGFEYRRYCDMADGEPGDPRSVAYFDHLVRRGLADLYDLGKLTPDHPGARMQGFVSSIPLEHSVEVWTGDEAVQFLSTRPVDRPFLLQLSFQRPHDPYAPSGEAARWYESGDIELPQCPPNEFADDPFQKPAFQRAYLKGPAGGYPYIPESAQDLKRQLALYYALITLIDQQIGRVLEALRARDQYRDTIVVYHADHGDFAGEHGLMLKNLGVYESIHRIPLVLRYPGCVPKRESGLVQSVDLFPTLCHLAGLPLLPGLDGAVIAGEGACFRDHVVCEWDYPFFPQRRVVAVRTATHRLVHYHDAPADGEFYDCESDPAESVNLYRAAEHAVDRENCYRLITDHLSNARRRHSPVDDAEAQAAPAGPTRQIHKMGRKWSELGMADKASRG